MSAHGKIPVCREYLDQEACLREAQLLLQEGKVHGMSEKQIAREIHFHAAMYYYCEKTGRFPGFREHAGIIDLHDGGDTRLRRTAYTAYWMLRKLRRRSRSDKA